MPTHIALLRAINLGGHNAVLMSELRELVESLGMPDVKSLLQSGNLVFRSARRTPAAMERLLEIETNTRFGISVDYFVRTADEWTRIVAGNPFPDEAQNDPGHLVVMFLKKAPRPADVKALSAAIRGPETVRHDGRQLYIYYPAGIGRSKLTGALIEKKLHSRGTARNWNTVLKLAALAGPVK
jgi:uncharacterized protein (DUF1697 family)